VYLYGSAIVGGLQKYSDIDLFVVANRPSTVEEKAYLANRLLQISGFYPMSRNLRPIELTIVVKSEVIPWRYPPTFDFQYGEWLRKDFEAGKIEPWPTKEMPDLALLVTQVLLASKILDGPAPHRLLAPVPYRDAAIKEMDNLMADLDSDTRNVLLTLARIWCTVETDTIRSKPEAAAWTLAKLPEDYKPVMQRARTICLGKEPEHWDDIAALLRPCAEFIVSQVKKQTAWLASLSHANRTIRLNQPQEC
jgi:streptomycin 3"-adenylyltransferase